MWAFGYNGVSIYNPDGSEEVKSHAPEKVCYNTTNYRGDYQVRCDFMDVESDNKKYIWAAVSRGIPKINVFSIDTGDMVGAFPTCDEPRDLELHALRDEMWVHCSNINNITNSHMDVFSTSSPAATTSPRVLMHNATSEMRSYGKTVVDSSLGDVAYSTVYGMNKLFKVSLSDKTVMEEIVPSDNDAIYGYYDMAYSAKNQHIFVRTQVCCSCNFVGADQLECDRYGSYNITLDGKLVEGQCGRHCAGGVRDTIGILEFDTNTDTVVGTHSFVGSAPVETPISSPDGEYIVLFGLNGGKLVTILQAGETGEKSSVAYNIDLDFNTTLAEDDNVYSDLAFINHKGKDLLILSSAAENKVAIIDMSKSQPEASYVMLRPGAFEGRVRSRQLEWAVDTDYVWISGRSYKEIYVVDFMKKELVRTFENNEVRKLLSVINNDFLDLTSQIETQWVESDVFSKHNSDNSDDTSTSSSSNAMKLNDNSGGNDDNNNILNYVSIVLSIVALVAVIFNVISMNNHKSKLALMRAGSDKVSLAEIREMKAAKGTSDNRRIREMQEASMQDAEYESC